MIPTSHFLWFIILLLLAGLIPALEPEFSVYWWSALALLFTVAVVDAIFALRLPTPEVARKLPGSLALGVGEPIQLKLNHHGKHPLKLDVYDMHPVEMQVEGMPRRVELKPGGFADVFYTITPLERGETVFTGTQLLLHSPLRLWRRKVKLKSKELTRVYPNFAAVAKYTLLAADNRLSQMGIRKIRRRGEGQDFHQLREYRQGDPLRQIDWKASSRLRKLISREYQEERDQEIIFLLDCGHRMLARDGELSHFDHSLNAILLLAYVALRQGDGVGFGNFSGEERWLYPIKGHGMINHLYNTLYDLQPTSQAPDYAAAATHLMLRQKKRALIVIITNLRDEDTADLMPAIHLLRRRHLVLVASMREQALDLELEKPIDDFDQALRHAATRDYLQERDRSVDALRSNSVICLDVIPQDLSVSLVNQYLDIKSSGKL